ncbi:penicillin-binding protein 1A [Chitinimonas sp. BJYL2]|uniref:penicillin-binding protein 1A n=1 Tax=Chitinimonas sp. BJYL2 TaxID=2976696 RepID=UPI0022B3F261|nr:penicillin-binding protein 1A [Chitinimonas sp. BJYL2]
MKHRWILLAAGIASTLVVGAGGAIALAVATVYPRLPSLETLTDYRPKIPLRVYTQDGVQIGEFGEEKRDFVAISKVPLLMKQAILAAEDERFYQHGGVDYIGVARAALSNLIQGHAQSGASTITMQVARNFFLSSEKTFSRKFNEALLSFKIEHNLSKDQILELYFNQIYLGQRAYGFSSAAQVYFGKTLEQLSPAEMAMLAGLPKAPSSYNPVVNPARAKLRQQYVLRRMRELKFLDPAQYQAATKEVLSIRKASEAFSVAADYVAEMARQVVVEKYRDAAYTQGFNVYTTLVASRQHAAYAAARKGVLDYDRRHGYRGPEGFLDLKDGRERDTDWLDEQLSEIRDAGDLRPAVVLSTGNGALKVYIKGGIRSEIKGKALQFASRALSKKLSPNQQLRAGAVIRAYPVNGEWHIGQLPQVEVALVSLDPSSGAIQALVGGFDFSRNNFNRVTQAWRQPGSSFKPFVYSAGIERGLTPATVINDAPLVIDPASVGGQQWEPKNFDGKFDGPMTIRNALTKSKNLVSIRILQAISPEYAQAYISKFGFEARHHPAYLTMALGAGSVTPLQMAEGYAVFANGGYRIRSYFIDRIEDTKGRVLARTEPEVAGKDAPRTLDARNAFIMTSMMRDVTRFGTAAKANVLNRNDIAGKTGTTNDSHDAWFAGYQGTLVSVAWLGFDQPRSLGGAETGGQAALPIWINYMASALKDAPEHRVAIPEGVIVRTIEGSKGPRDEFFYAEFPDTNPELALESTASAPLQSIEDGVKDLLF